MSAPKLWWSPSIGGLLVEGDGMYWVLNPSRESLRHRLGTGPDSNPPLPEDAVPLASAGLLQEPQPAGLTISHKTEGGMCCNGKHGCAGPGSYCCSQTVYVHQHDDGTTGPFDTSTPARPAVDDDTERRYQDLLGAIELYVDWRYVTRQLTTEQKELWADTVEAHGERAHPGEPTTVDRWWR